MVVGGGVAVVNAVNSSNSSTNQNGPGGNGGPGGFGGAGRFAGGAGASGLSDALYGDFVRGVNKELPIWCPIEQIFVTVITAKARNHSNTPRWGSSSWHDLWLAE